MHLKRIVNLLVIIFFLSAFLEASDKYAIIIGINDYDLLSDLKAGVNDAERIKEYYKDLGFKVWLISDNQESRLEKPSLQNLRRILDNVKEISEGRQIDEFVFFFAGHGVQIKGENYLCFPESVVISDIGMLSVDRILIPWIRDLSAKLSLVYLDACRNDLGPMRAAGVERGLEVKGFTGQSRDIAIFYAAKPGAFSYEKPDGTNGFFTDTLLEALQSPSTNNIAELFKYLRTALLDRTEDVYGRPQIPHLGGDFDLTTGFSKGTSDFNLFDQTAKLFVNASQQGAQIKIDGVVRGETPLLLEGIKPGELFVEVEKDGMYASEQITLVANAFEKIDLEMIQLTGDIFIGSLFTYNADLSSKTEVHNIPNFLNKLNVLIDGELVHDYSAGLISNIKAGTRDIIVKGDGWYWENRITVEANDAKLIHIELGQVGNITIESNVGSIIKLKSVDDEYEIICDKSTESYITISEVPVGVWEISVMCEGFELYTELTEILMGQNTTIKPELKFNRSTIIKMELDDLKTNSILFYNQLEKRKNRDVIGWVSTGIGASLLTVTGYFIYSAYESYQDYLIAENTSKADQYREETSLSFNIGLGTAIGGFVGVLVGVPALTSGPQPNDILPAIEKNEIRIRELELELEQLENRDE